MNTTNNSIQIDTSELSDFDPLRYKKLKTNAFQKSNLNMLVSELPTFLASETLSKAYILKFPDGVQGTLMRYKNGGVGTPIQGKNGIVGHASLYDLSYNTTLLNAFSAMSIATGQYFLTEINTKLNSLNQKIDDVLNFLYGDKKAELISELNFVKQAYENFSSMMNHDFQRIATISSLQESKKIAMKDIEFYISDLDLKTHSDTKNYSDFERMVNDAFNIKDSLDLAMQLYVMASILEINYSENSDYEYIESIKEDLNYYINKCNNRILTDFSGLSALLKTQKSFPLKKINTSTLENKITKIIQSLNTGTPNELQQTISEFDNYLGIDTIILSDDGNIYMPIS